MTYNVFSRTLNPTQSIHLSVDCWTSEYENKFSAGLLWMHWKFRGYVKRDGKERGWKWSLWDGCKCFSHSYVKSVLELSTESWERRKTAEETSVPLTDVLTDVDSCADHRFS